MGEFLRRDQLLLHMKSRANAGAFDDEIIEPGRISNDYRFCWQKSGRENIAVLVFTTI